MYAFNYHTMQARFEAFEERLQGIEETLHKLEELMKFESEVTKLTRDITSVKAEMKRVEMRSAKSAEEFGGLKTEATKLGMLFSYLSNLLVVVSDFILHPVVYVTQNNYHVRNTIRS